MKDISCETCGNLIPLGEGDHMCDVDPSQLVLEDYEQTEDYFWCHGKYWKER